jgi:two-component system response regulator NreC
MTGAVEVQGRITILVADDHTVMRTGLRLLLQAETDFEVVAEAGNIQGVFQQARTHRPAVLLLDLNMPGGSSVAAISRLAQISPTTAVVVLTMEHDAGFMREAYGAGAKGYVLKEAAASELVGAIRSAAHGAGAGRVG